MGLRRARRVGFYLLVRGLDLCVRTVPSTWARRGLRGLAAVAWTTRPGDRHLALRQLEIAFPGRSPEWRRRIARNSLSRLADNLLANVRGDAPVSLDARSRRALEDLSSSSRPIVVLMAHYSAWELAGPVLARRLSPFAALTANPHNHRVDAWLRRRRRERRIEVFDRDRGRLSAARWLRRGGSLAVLADHRSGSTRLSPWFGRPTPTVVGPARLARWAGAHMVGVHVRGGPDAYELVVGPQIEAAATRSEDELVAWCNACTESWIRQDPEQWTWWHDRFDLEGCNDA